MEDKARLLGDSPKVEVTVTEMEYVKEYELPHHVESVPSRPKLSALSIGFPRLTKNANSDGTNGKSQTFLIPPRDSGWAAWRVLCGAILVQGILFAFPLTFGVFQDYFRKDNQLSDDTMSIWIGVLSTGVPFMGAPFMTVICETYPRINRRYYVLLGWTICAASLVGGSFSKSLKALTLTQGMLYGIGLLILDVPVLMILNTWFVKRRGTAYGLLFGITDLIGFGATILADFLLRKYTLRGTLLTFGCSLLAICGPAMWLLKSRPDEGLTPRTNPLFEDAPLTPLARRTSSSLCPPVTTRYYDRPVFYIFALANFFHSLAYYLPFIYLPSYTTDLGFSPTRGAYLLAAANFAQIFGEIGFGQLSDKVNVHCLILACSLVSSIVTLTLWGLANNLVMLAFFTLIFGSFGSGFISLWARMGTFFGQKDAQMIFSIMSFGRGVASIAAGPISSALLTAATPKDPAHESSSRYGNGKYVGIVVFVGASTAISALLAIVGLVLGWQGHELGRVKRRKAKGFQSLKG